MPLYYSSALGARFPCHVAPYCYAACSGFHCFINFLQRAPHYCYTFLSAHISLYIKHFCIPARSVVRFVFPCRLPHTIMEFFNDISFLRRLPVPRYTIPVDLLFYSAFIVSLASSRDFIVTFHLFETCSQHVLRVIAGPSEITAPLKTPLLSLPKLEADCFVTHIFLFFEKSPVSQCEIILIRRLCESRTLKIDWQFSKDLDG